MQHVFCMCSRTVECERRAQQRVRAIRALRAATERGALGERRAGSGARRPGRQRSQPDCHELLEPAANRLAAGARRREHQHASG